MDAVNHCPVRPEWIKAHCLPHPFFDARIKSRYVK